MNTPSTCRVETCNLSHKCPDFDDLNVVLHDSGHSWGAIWEDLDTGILTRRVHFCEEEPTLQDLRAAVAWLEDSFAPA